MEIERNLYYKKGNNFADTADIPSIQIIKSNLEFIPKVTIAIPTYKRTDLLKESIDSALNQERYHNFDVIVVDNNPEREDEVEHLMLTYDNPRLSYYKNTQNLGMVGNWNRLYTLAKGEWVVMLHDDDLLYSDYLYYMFEVIMPWCNYKYDIYSTPYHMFNMKAGLDKPVRTGSQFNAKQMSVSDFYFGNVMDSPLGICIKKEVIQKLGGFRSEYYPILDYDFYILATRSFNVAKITGLPLCIYRIQENESCKIETIREFASKMNCIIEALIGAMIKPQQWFWRKNKGIVIQNLLIACKREFLLSELNIVEELDKLIIRNDSLSRIINRGVSYCFRIKSYFKTRTLKV